MKNNRLFPIFALYLIKSMTAEKQQQFDRSYLEMATVWGRNSYCKRRQVGAIIVKDRMIISDGYNGTPSGFENVCEDEQGITLPYVLHAEANAITKVAKSNNSSEGATLYITTSPCVECAKLIIQAGITRVVYSTQYRITDGIDLLRRAGIEVTHININTQHTAPSTEKNHE
jgi:dCMP deaminase